MKIPNCRSSGLKYKIKDYVLSGRLPMHLICTVSHNAVDVGAFAGRATPAATPATSTHNCLSLPDIAHLQSKTM